MATILVLTMTACQTNRKNDDEKKWNPTFSIIRTIITGTK